MQVNPQPERYARQIALPEIGQKGQRRLAQARVLVIGAGGLGAPALLYLAAAGIGTLGIADDDRVDTGNLQRQVLYGCEDVGDLKTKAAAEKLGALNPQVRIRRHEARVEAGNALQIMADYDVVIDATDRLEGKFLINDAAAKAGKPLVYASALGFEAQVAVFDARQGPCLRCLFPEPPDVPALTCAEAGILGAVTGVAGSAQALEAIKLVLAVNDPQSPFQPLLGRLWLLDARDFRARTVSVPRDPECTVCRQPAGAIELPSAALREITAEQLGEHPEALLIDVRENEEWASGHLTGAVHLPLSQLMETVPDLPSRGTYITYCAHGIRSQAAAQLLAEAGYRPVYSLRGGIAGVRDRDLEHPERA